MADLDHIGIAVVDLKSVRQIFDLLGLPVVHSESVRDQGVITHCLPFGTSANSSDGHLELLEVTDPLGTVAKFIQKRGPGIHHISFKVNFGELDPLCEKLKSHGIQLVYDQPKIGSHEMRINFIHPSSAGGILIEVMEPTKNL